MLARLWVLPDVSDTSSSVSFLTSYLSSLFVIDHKFCPDMESYA